jgi:radical SAM superfamily enzyme YgiQ (UPF0313 family)
MDKSIYLINPRENGPGYHGFDVFEGWNITRLANLADLSTTTVAALVPPGWTIAICDERLQRVDLDVTASVIGITGKVSQRDRMVELADEFRRRGKLVLMGGPYASLNPGDVRPHADILAVGELEEIAASMFSDIAAGRWQAEYVGTRPDLALSPIPRWDLYPPRGTTTGQVQTSRGCPFECEFCDVIQYLGRKQRWKHPEQVVRELDVLYRMGFRGIFFADDNFTVVRRRTRALLERVAQWNAERSAGRVEFATQVSIDLARDPELLAQCVEAGLTSVFIGIETPNAESLAETLKRQNLRVDLRAEVTKVVSAGLMVLSGGIIGFDHDGPDAFERQAAFIDDLPVPLVSIGLLVAPPSTPLHARMEREGRLISHGRVGLGMLVSSNFEAKQMSAAQLKAGMEWLLNRVYAPHAFAKRVQAFAETCGTRRVGIRARPLFDGRDIEVPLARRLAQFGRDEQDLLHRLQKISLKRPDLASSLRTILVYYCQYRFVLDYYGVWNPQLAHRDAPMAA